MTSSYLELLAAGRLFGVRLTGAIEILPWRRSRAVPLSFNYVEGLIDYRGTIYPVFSLVKRLALNRPGVIGFAVDVSELPETGQSIILLEDKKFPFGIVADRVVKMAEFEDPMGSPENSMMVDPQYVKGIVFDGDKEITILDFERLFHAR